MEYALEKLSDLDKIFVIVTHSNGFINSKAIERLIMLAKPTTF